MDPTLKSDTLAALKQGILDFSPQMKAAAKYVVDHPATFGLESIRESARKAGVSTYTFVKMSKNLGFSSFEAFRHPFRQALMTSAQGHAGPDWLQALRGSSEPGALCADAAQNALSIVAQSMERQRLGDLEEVCDLLMAARCVFVTGVRSSYAVAYYLHYVGRMALPSLQLIPRHHNSPLDDLNDAEAGDVLIAITVTPYSRETIEACAFARKRGVKLVLISDSELSTPELEPEHRLVASVLSTHHFGCLSGMMSVVELLIAMLMHRGGPAAFQRIKSYQRLRKDHNAYWPK
jgi:DNA-binding MurR/RpiR family transcriptional regulator